MQPSESELELSKLHGDGESSSPPPTSLPTVLITGCSSGIGLHCAVELAQSGWRVLAGVRSAEDGNQVVAAAGPNAVPLILDVTDPGSIADSQQFVQRLLGDSRLDGLVNNAGILIAGPLESIDTAQMRRQFEVNVFGVHALTCAMLPLMKRPDILGSKSNQPKRPSTARLILMGSISGRITPPLYGAYAASKHALEAIADAWRMELRQSRVDVSMIQPDSVATPIWRKATETLDNHSQSPNQSSSRSTQVSGDAAAGLLEQVRNARRSGLVNARSGMPPSRVVAAVRHALSASKPRTHYPVGWRTRASFVAQKWLPTRMFDAILQQAIESK